MKKISIVIVISSIVVISLAALGFYLHQEDKAVDAIKTGSSRISKQIDQRKPISFLLLGVDPGADGRVDRGLSDSMMVVILNPV